MDLNEFAFSDFINNLFSDKKTESIAGSDLIDNLYSENIGNPEGNKTVASDFTGDFFGDKKTESIAGSNLIDNLYSENIGNPEGNKTVASDFIGGFFGNKTNQSVDSKVVSELIDNLYNGNIDISGYNNIVPEFASDLNDDTEIESDDKKSEEEAEAEGEYICTVCKSKNDMFVCKNCGFDNSCNYERYPTLQKIAEKTPSVLRLKTKIKSLAKPSVEKSIAFLREQKWDESVISEVEEILTRASKSFEEQGENMLRVGETVVFGSYPQEMLKTPTGIEWEVIDVMGNRALLLSKKCLDARPYESIRSETTWPYSTLRKWLNYDFFNDAFNIQDKNAIVENTVSDSCNPRSNINSGTSTDKVFILSREELIKYKLSKEKIICKATKHAINNGVFCDSATSEAYWWLRTPGYSSVSAMYVMGGAVTDELGYNIKSANKGVRPAVWVDMEKIKS